jgi:hypothetical protein
MKPHPLPLAVAAVFTAVGLSSSAHAQLISSESFWTTTTNPPPQSQYAVGNIANPNISGCDTTVVVAGNSGFDAGNAWQSGTSGLPATADLNPTHTGLVGSSRTGSLRLNPFQDATNRNSNILGHLAL